MSIALLLLSDCDACGGAETRLFRDSWTGLELCIACLYPILGSVRLSPEEEDNLHALLGLTAPDTPGT